MSRRSTIGWTIVLLSAFGLATVAAMFGPFLYALLTARSRFIQHADDARPTVEAAYRHHYQHGQWPKSLDDLLRDDRPGEGWAYLWHGTNVEYGPTLRAQGPLHMSLVYSFPKSPGEPCRGWVLRCEGDETPIDVDQPIPEPPPSPAERSP
ncbi:MAG: hypothetical protein RIC55_08455 [Pirellulaceae bacterium]